MTDTEMLDWLEGNALSLRFTDDDKIKMVYINNKEFNKESVIYGKTIRDCIKNAALSQGG